jgi:hypothetical protein
LPTYVAKFERTLYEAGGGTWVDVNKIVSFRNGLNDAIRNRLQNQLNLPTTYPEYLRTVQQLASKTAAPLYVQAPRIAHDPMDVSELTISAFTTAPSNPPPSNRSNALAQSISLQLRSRY